MRKCKCNTDNPKETAAKEAQLWQNMVESLMQFTETSTALMTEMQSKLGTTSDPDKKMCDPCGFLEKLKEELEELEAETKMSAVCACVSQPMSNDVNDDDPNAEVVPGIACHKQPNVIRKKKYKYSTEIESKLLAQKRRTPACQCNKDSENLTVDACVCKSLPEGIELRETCDKTVCPITVCSALEQENVENVYCSGEIVEVQPTDEKVKDDPLAWIRKPGSFDPNTHIAQTRWKVLREKYSVERRKEKINPTEFAAKNPWALYSNMSFLEKHVTMRKRVVGTSSSPNSSFQPSSSMSPWNGVSKIEIEETEMIDEYTESSSHSFDHSAEILEQSELPQDDNHPFVIKTQEYGELRNASLGQEILKAMRQFGSHTAQIDDSLGISYSYEEYTRKCILVAMKLKKDFTKHDIIGICTDIHMNTYIPYLAGLFNGNRVVAFDRLSSKQEMKNCLEKVTPNIMFTNEDCVTFLQECMQAIGVSFKIVLYDEGHSEFDGFESYLVDYGKPLDNFAAENIDSVENTCLICFNGGIPESKAVCLSHGSVLRQSLRMVSSQQVPPVICSFLETFQISSLIFLFSSILGGATRVIVEKFNENNIWKLVQKYKINALHLYPYQCTMLAKLPEPEEDTFSLIYIFTGGEKLQAPTLVRLNEVLLKTIVVQTYEHTELAGAVTAFNFAKPEDSIFSYFRTKSCGRPIDGIWYKVIDIKTRKIVHQLAPGELFVKTKSMRNGYFNKNVEEPCEKENWTSTGDLVFYDTYKCFHHINRMCDLIKCKNKIIFPSKLEDILLNHPLINDAVVVAVPNEEEGQHAVAIISVKENEDIYSQDIEDWMKDKVPEEEQLKGGIKIVGKIPHFHTGKINRTAICPIDPSKC